MEKTQVSTALITPTSEKKARNNIDRPLKPWNPNLYYSNLYMEYYYFCQQCKDPFKVAKLLSNK